MNPTSLKTILIATLVIGIAANVLDYLIHGLILQSVYTGNACFADLSGVAVTVWLIIADFVLALVFTVFYGKVQSSFTKSPAGVMVYGMILALVICIPANVMVALMIKGFPFWLCWAWTLAFVIEFAVYGLILGFMTKPKTAA